MNFPVTRMRRLRRTDAIRNLVRETPLTPDNLFGHFLFGVANAPVDILPHMGSHRGKAEVREMWETVHTRYSAMRHEVPIVVADSDKVATLIRLFFRKRSNDRIVQFDLAAFYTLRDGRITEIREILDSFDLVQQVLERDVSAVLTGKPGVI